LWYTAHRIIWLFSHHFQEADLESLQLAHNLVDIVEQKQATDIVLLDVHEQTSLAHYFIIATVDNERQAKAIEDDLLEKLKLQQNLRPLSVDGLDGQGGGWSILDYGDVIVHLFTSDMRRHYRLEELWNKAHIVVKML
jgi:ribosome-associated protein